MKVDILLPVYNGEKYLEEQIKSLLLQEYKNIKIIIRDDMSIDNSMKIIEKYSRSDKRIKVLYDQYGNVGLVRNIEILLNESDADYIMYCDQDDVWFKNKIDKMMKEILKYDNSEALLVHSDSYITNEKLKIRRKFKGDRPLISGVENMYFNYIVQGATVIFNKKLKNKLLPFPKEAYIHDRYTHLIAELEGKRVYLNEPLMYYRQHESNVLGSNDLLIKKIKNNINLLSKKIYIEKDKKLFEFLYKKPKYKNQLNSYFEILNTKGYFDKIKIIKKYKINLRLKEKIIYFISK